MLLYNIWFFQRLAYSPYPFQHEEWSSKDLWLRVLSARAEIIGVINLMKMKKTVTNHYFLQHFPVTYLLPKHIIYL